MSALLLLLLIPFLLPFLSLMPSLKHSQAMPSTLLLWSKALRTAWELG